MRSMRIGFVLRGYLEKPSRTLAAVLGVTLPVVSILIQFGFYGAVMTTSTQFYRHLRFDLVLLSPDYLVFSRPGSIARSRLTQALAVSGVREVDPLYVGFQDWKAPRADAVQQILVLGVDPERNPFSAVTDPARLRRRDTLLFDRRSRRDLGVWKGGMVAELGSRAMDVTDTFAFGPGFSALGLCVVSDRTFERLAKRSDRVSIGLVQVDDSRPPEVVAQRLHEILPNDVVIETREQLLARERSYWRSATSLGVNLAVGCGVALLVGIIVIYNVLSSDISNRLSEYATLKAMGFDDGLLSSLIRIQAGGFALMAFLPSLGLAEVGYWITRKETFLPVSMSWFRVAGVLGLGIAMSLISAGLALKRLERADPGDLF